MFFTYASRILSGLTFFFGAYALLMGLSIASGWIELPQDIALARYLPGSQSTGRAMDKGAIMILVAVALGALAEISFTLRSIRDKL